MNDNAQIGIYGKLPAYGDFIQRNLDSIFINPWDEWLQHYISGSREQLGEKWEEIYLTSPIWRFALSAGVVDDRVWAGLMMPSADKVGRYFPISIVVPMAKSVSPVNVLAAQDVWFNHLETHCLDALGGELDADELFEATSQVEFQPYDYYEPTFHLGETGSMVIGLKSSNEDAFKHVLPYVLNSRLNAELSSFSLWQTTGSDRMSPVIICCQGLPSLSGLASMLDGQWQKRNWKIPYTPRT